MDFTSVSSHADPELYMAQFEYSLELKDITSQKEKITQAVLLLPAEISKQVRNIILKPPATNPFQELKREILSRTAVSDAKKDSPSFI